MAARQEDNASLLLQADLAAPLVPELPDLSPQLFVFVLRELFERHSFTSYCLHFEGLGTFSVCYGIGSLGRAVS